jgi:hypothetical protein
VSEEIYFPAAPVILNFITANDSAPNYIRQSLAMARYSAERAAGFAACDV